MALIDLYSGLTEFMAVAEHGSFRAAAAQLRVSAAAVSQAVKALEARVGTLLFLRTTRSVALTEAGARLHGRLRPAAGEIAEGLGDLDALRQRPRGVLRLSVPRIALELVVLRVLPGFRSTYPDITVELDVSDTSVDIAAQGFDAGVRIGDLVARDMVAVPLTPNFRWRVLGAPAYLERHGVPKTPADLLQHQCIGYRFPSAKTVYRWRRAGPAPVLPHAQPAAAEAARLHRLRAARAAHRRNTRGQGAGQAVAGTARPARPRWTLWQAASSLTPSRPHPHFPCASPSRPSCFPVSLPPVPQAAAAARFPPAGPNPAPRRK